MRAKFGGVRDRTVLHRRSHPGVVAPGPALPEIPQQELLNTAKVFVTHAGYSSVREALTAGVPMVCLPLFADQRRNAARIQDLKAGIQVEVKDLTAAVLAERVHHVLDTRTYCDAAESFAAEMAELPVFTNIPDHLVSAA
ncbi:glycosyltransferase [Lentzea sp. BCCO 10_0856]|uniref:Glycosyltransferase n=1 Tax=Lentzea miocenica TaxID=3095431 RepID=A0ABU4T156_9PSEU|nr:nucleotide disphospho-sugar-binding domain-containing protein [Lentzea sp. BCCO 10_0856]MDX8031894.1 glycosyltransferase [Lentzea sp. BCCO 10_0856]